MNLVGYKNLPRREVHKNLHWDIETKEEHWPVPFAIQGIVYLEAGTDTHKVGKKGVDKKNSVWFTLENCKAGYFKITRFERDLFFLHHHFYRM